jgi:fimbrial isopeptide formation D2 family protein
MLLTGVLVALPVEQAEADSLELGPDGYFSTLSAGATPVASNGWANTRRIEFGKQGTSGTYAGAEVSGGYKTLGYGGNTGIASVMADFSTVAQGSYAASGTTSVAADEVLLFAEDVVTPGVQFEIPRYFSSTWGCTNNSGPSCNVFDWAGIGSSYQSQLAITSTANNSIDGYGTKTDIVDYNYSPIEVSQLRTAPIEGVCTESPADGCLNATAPILSDSNFQYSAFPLSSGDLAKYLDHTTGNDHQSDPNLSCPLENCANETEGYWLRTANYTMIVGYFVFDVERTGHPDGGATNESENGLRPAVRVRLDNLLLSANGMNQTQVLSSSDSLRLTFVDGAAGSLSNASAVAVKSRLTLSGSHGLQDGFGFKLVDPAEPTKVVASGLSASGVVDVSELPGVVSGKAYDVYWWGQENGSADTGWSNRATEPQMTSLTFTIPSYGIELTGRSDGALTAYRIGEYRDEVFDQTGALKSVMLNTPSGLGTVLKDTAESAGGVNVDADNPVGWVASRWLGYPTDPLSDDVTSAFNPYAGSLQVFAQELAEAVETDASALGASAGSLPAGTFPQPESTAMLPVSGPGLYLIVDSTQGSGGSLPIIVGTKVFNEALEDVVEDGMVDFVDAGVKGKPRLGRAVLKTSVTDVAKRVVNDAGLDGFDVGSSVEFEIALRVPDLSSFTSVAYDSYKFNLTDVAASGLTLPVDGSGVEVFVDALSSTEPQSLPSSSIAVSGDTLTVDGLRALFAESSGSGVRNKDSVPVGSLMRLRYAAVLNTGASFSAPDGGGLDPNANTVTLTRSTSDGDTEQKTASANAYSFKVDVVKVDKDDTSKALGDAKFEVSRDGQALKFTQVSAGVYRLDAAGGTEVTTHADGTLTLLGVEARDLSFRETQAPDGYFTVSDFTVEVVPVWNADASEVTVASYRTGGTNLAYVSQDGRSVTVADPSKSLANLPYTGGIGILLLVIIGGLFLMVAVRPYYLSHRAEATANILM